jgi:hypothetical protein
MAELQIIFNKDRTITVKSGRQVEHVTTLSKSKGEIFDAVKWAAITMGAPLSDIALTELLQRMEENFG